MRIFGRLFPRTAQGAEGQEVDGASEALPLQITGMTCQGCADNIQRFLKHEQGVQRANIDWKTGAGTVVFDPNIISEDRILTSRIFAYGAFRAERSEEEI